MTTAGLSFAEHRFGQTYATRIFLAVLMLGTLFLAWSTVDNPTPSAHLTLLWISVGTVLALVALWIVIGKTVLTISDQGVRRDSVFGRQEMPWSQIAETRYVVTPVRLYVHFGLIGALLASMRKTSPLHLSLTLVSNDGRRLKVSSNFRKAKEAVGIIFNRILPQMVTTVRARMQRGETVNFGPIALSASSLVWKKQPPIFLGDLSSAEIIGSRLRIKRTGKWTSVVSVRSDKVPDVLVFMEVLETLAPQLKSSGIDPLARVRL
jgi:Bacterial PH domain